ncbi:MAG: hypothetical protein ACRDSS_13490, partial [Actinocrinis sp.]
DQAIAEMNARREDYLVRARIKARAAARAAGAAQGTSGEGMPGDVKATDIPETATVPVDSGTVRWSWFSFTALGACLAYLIVALIVH